MPENPVLTKPVTPVVTENSVILKQVPAVAPEGPEVVRPVAVVVPVNPAFVEWVPPLKKGKHGTRHSTHQMCALQKRQIREWVLAGFFLTGSVVVPAVWVLAKIATTPLIDYLPRINP